MDFTALQQALTPVGSTITISTETLPAPFADFLKSHYFKQGRQIVISNAQLAADAARGVVEITGRANVLDAANLPVTASFSLDAAGNVAAVLRYTLLDLGGASSGWKLSWLLLELPGELSLRALSVAAQWGMRSLDARRQGIVCADLPPLLDRMPLVGADLLVTTGAYTDPETQTAFRGGIHFLGQLQPAALLGPLGAAVAPTQRVAVHGEIVVVEDPTQLVLPVLSRDPFAVTLYPWEVAPALPGVHLQAALGLETRLGNLLLRDTMLRLYSPPSEDLLSDEDPLRPLIAVTGRFLIPSANVEIDAIARMASRDGQTEVLLEARPEGLSIANLAAMADLAGSGDSMSALPDSLAGVIRALSKLELTDVALMLSAGAGGPSVSWASFSIGARGARWKVWKDDLTVKDLGLRVSVTDPFGTSGTRRTDVAVKGTALIEGVPIEVVASTDGDGFTLAGVLLTEQTLPLAGLMKKWSPKLPAPGNLTVDRLRVSYTSGGAFRVSGALAQDPGWKIPLGPGGLMIEDVEFDLDSPESGGATVSFRGAIAFSKSVKLAMSYQLPGPFVLRATCDEISLRGLAATLSSQEVWLPKGFDLTLRDSSVQISDSGSQDSLVFQLATRVEGVGLFAFEARNRRGGWGFAAGFDLGPSKASSLSGMSGLAAFERLLRLSKLMLVVSTFDDAKFQFPDAAQFNNPRIGSGKIALPGSGGIVAGCNLFAQWSVDGEDKIQKMLAKLLGLGATVEVTVQLSEQQTRVFFRYDGKLLGQPMTALGGVQSVGSQLSWFLAGTLKAKIQGQPQTFDVAMAVTPSGALFSGSMKGATAVDLGPFKLSHLALEVVVNWAGVPSLGIAATIDVKQFQSSVAVFFDSTEPSRSLVAGSLGELTMKDVFDTLTGGAVKSPIDGVLSSIAIRGTGAFTIPGNLAGDLDGLVFDKVASAFAAAKLTIPSDSSQLLLVVNQKGKAWHLTDLTAMRHYQLEKSGDQIQVSIAPQFYFAPQPTSIGTQRYPQGFNLNAALSFAGFDAAVKVDISAGQGIAVDAQIDKITLLDENLFSLAAFQGGGGPKLSLATFQQASHPDEKLRPPHFYLNGRLVLLGASVGIYASISPQGVDLELQGSLVPGVSFDLDVRFGKAGLGAAGSCKVGIGTIDLGVLGKAKINTSLVVAIELEIDMKPTTKTLPKGGSYLPGTTVLENELLKLVFEKNGNLVLYRGGGTDWDALWSTGTGDQGAVKLAFQQDGNLVVYTPSLAIWNSQTAGRNVTKLALQADCNLCLYDDNRTCWWNSETAGQMAIIAMESAFTFAGETYHIARFKLSAKPDTFQQLPAILGKKIEAALGGAFQDATKWLNATKNGLVDGVTDTSKVLRDVYKKSEAEAKKLAGQTANAVSNTASDAVNISKKTIKKAKFF